MASEPIWPDGRVPPSIVVEQIRQAYEAGRYESREEIENLRVQIEQLQMQSYPSQKVILDELKDLCQHGDIIIRQVGNGHIIRRIPGSYTQPTHGMPVETWVVEGDLVEVAKELTAILAREATAKAMAAATDPRGAMSADQNTNISALTKSF